MGTHDIRRQFIDFQEDTANENRNGSVKVIPPPPGYIPPPGSTRKNKRYRYKKNDIKIY